MGAGQSQVEIVPYISLNGSNEWVRGTEVYPGPLMELAEIELVTVLHGKMRCKFAHDSYAIIRDQIGTGDSEIAATLNDWLAERDAQISAAMKAYDTAYVACCDYIGKEVVLVNEPSGWTEANVITFRDKLAAIANEFYGPKNHSWRSFDAHTGFEWINYSADTFAFDIQFILGCSGEIDIRKDILRVIAAYIISVYEEVFWPVADAV